MLCFVRISDTSYPLAYVRVSSAVARALRRPPERQRETVGRRYYLDLSADRSWRARGTWLT